MKPLYIFDLDGTLALIEHRRHFVERERGKQDWTAFYAACDKDEPNSAVIHTLNQLALLNEIWIFSGRSDEVEGKTIAWLIHHTSLGQRGYSDVNLTMRREGDYTPDDELKQFWLHSMLPVDRNRLVAVFEDRDRMVKMWRGEGVACFQVAPGDF